MKQSRTMLKGLFLIVSVTLFAMQVPAQNKMDYEAERKRAFVLLDENNVQ